MNDDMHRNRAQTLPTGGLDGSSHPRSLRPGGAPRTSVSERSHLFSANQTRLSITNDVRDTHAAPLPQFYPRVANHLPPPPPLPPLPSRPPRQISSSIPHHPSLFFERSISSPPPPPPIPPKIPLFSKPTSVIIDESLLFRPAPAIPAPNAPVLDTISVSVKNSPPLPAHDFVEAALSQVVSKSDNEIGDKISLQEDEDFARALEASLLDHGGRGQSSTRLDVGAKPNASDTPPEPARSRFEGPTSSATEHQRRTSDPSPKSKDESPSFVLSPVSILLISDKDSKILDDEAYARQLAQEEEQNVTNSLPETREAPSTTDESSELPRYERQLTDHNRITRTEFIERSSPEAVTTTSTPVSNADVSHLPIQTNPVLPVPSTSPPLSRANPPSYTEMTPPLDASHRSNSPDVFHDPRNRIDAPRDVSHDLRNRIDVPRDVAHHLRNGTDAPRDVAHHLRNGTDAPRDVAHHLRNGTDAPRDVAHHLRNGTDAPRDVAHHLRNGTDAPRDMAHHLRNRTDAPRDMAHHLRNRTDVPRDVPHHLRNRTDAPRATILTPHVRNMHRADSFVSVLDTPRNEAQSSSEPRAQGLVNINSFVDKELFIGVSKSVFLLVI